MLFVSKKALSELIAKSVNAAVASTLSTSKEWAGVQNMEQKIALLEKERDRVYEELQKVKTTKKCDEVELKVLVKAQKQKLELEGQQQAVENERQWVEKEKQMLKDMQAKAEALLETNKKDVKEMLAQVMKCLPNVNARLRIDDKE